MRHRHLRLERREQHTLTCFSWDPEAIPAGHLQPTAVRSTGAPHMAAGVAGLAALTGGACLFVHPGTDPMSLAHALRSLADRLEARPEDVA